MTFNSYMTWMGSTSPHSHLSNLRTDNGPTELADVVVQLLRGLPEGGFEPENWLSESELRRLISVCFFTSLAPEEGRYPRCSIFWPQSKHEWFDTCEFCPDKPLVVESLRRLAPICQSRGSAICVSLREDVLRLVGMTTTRFDGLDFYAGRPGFVRIGSVPNVQVHIVAPGHIRIECGSIEFELRAGQLRQCPSLRSLACVKDLTRTFGESVAKAVISRCKLSDERCKLFGGLNECSDVEVILQMILRPILDLGHGGAVVVIPNQSESLFSNALESPNGVMNLSLFERAAEHLGACIACHNQDDLTDAFSSQSINRSLQTRGRLAIASRTIGELASVDGCVVLNRDLSVVSFGAKINTTREQAERSEIQFRNARTEAVLDLAVLEKEGGTRLRTALWLCKTFPNVIVFVVSQDQNLKVLWSENTTAFAFGPIALRTIPEFV